MNMALTPKQLGRRIAEQRKRKGYSQQDMARFLQIPRSSVAQIELGNRSVTVIELMKLSEALSFSIDKFLSKEYKIPEEAVLAEETAVEYKVIRVSEPVLNVEKFRNVLLYILERCAGKPNVGETVLYMLLYFSDFNYYEIYEEHLTGAEYRKLPFGPVPQKFNAVINHMMESGQLQRLKTDYHGFPQTRHLPMEKPDLTGLKASEIEVVNRVIELMSDWPQAMITRYTHKDLPWEVTDEGNAISYELAFYRELPYSVRVYDENEE